MSGSETSNRIGRAVSRRVGVALTMAFVASLMAGSASVQADSYPTRTVRMIVPFSPGGPTDVAARMVAEFLAQKWKQPVIVENRPGGGTVIGTAAAAQAQADGYTLLFGVSSAMVESGAMMRELPYDPIKSFAPVTEIYQISAGLSVNSKVPAKTVPELVALLRQKPLSYSSFGNGTGPHLLLETFKKAAGVDIIHVPYKGNAEGLMAVVGGQVDITGAGLGTIRPHLNSGALRLLAVGGDERSRFAPDVPTFKELGFANVGAGSQFVALWAPAGTPPDIIAQLNRDVVAALATPQFATFLDRVGYDKATALTPEKLENLVKASIVTWTPVIKSLGVRID